MAKLIALYLNPTKDLYQNIQVLAPGTVSHAMSSGLETAGKPVNAARSGAIMGARALVLGFCGKAEFEETQRDLAESDLAAMLFPLPGRSRICVILSEKSGRETVVNSREGLSAGKATIRHLKTRLGRRARKGDWVLSSGSLPPSLEPQEAAAFVRIAHERDALFALDQRGPALLAFLREKPDYVQANRLEYVRTFGWEPKNGRDVLRLLSRVRARGAETAAFLDGSRGAFLSAAEGHWRLRPPPLRARSSIGAGDAFMGGMLYGRCQGLSWPEALRWAGAAAAANVMSPGACRFRRALALRYYPRCRIERLKTQ